MQWSDEGYLLSKNNFNENSIIIEVFTLNHGKCTGIVYGGSSRKKKKMFQIGNKIFLNWVSKGVDRSGYFQAELIQPVAPLFFDDKKRSICILSATLILKILLPESQINKKIYKSFESLIKQLSAENWINIYINWELTLIKELGFEINLSNLKKINNTININDKNFLVPKLFTEKNVTTNENIREALKFNRNLFMEIFIEPNKLKLPLFRRVLEKYYS
jgi:DNA repair protein RecO (recombination protein O)